MQTISNNQNNIIPYVIQLIHIYVYLQHIYIYIYIHIIRTYIYIYIFVYICTYTFLIYVYIYIFIHLYIYIFRFAYKHSQQNDIPYNPWDFQSQHKIPPRSTGQVDAGQSTPGAMGFVGGKPVVGIPSGASGVRWGWEVWDLPVNIYRILPKSTFENWYLKKITY